MLSCLRVPAAVLLFFLAVDYLWIGLAANGFYVAQFGPIGRIVNGRFELRLMSAFLVYILMTAALVLHALPLMGRSEPYRRSFLRAAFLGFCCYGIYDLTNHATLSHWPLPLLLVDMSWGSFLFGAAGLFARSLRDRRGW